MPDADAFLDLAERQIAAPRKARMRAAEVRAARKAAADEALAERGEMYHTATQLASSWASSRA
jgi:hypothetical protein